MIWFRYEALPNSQTSVGYTTTELVRINNFVVRDDAAARDNQSVKALEEALDQSENAAAATLAWSA